MWLKRAVGLMLIITFAAMITIVTKGIFLNSPETPSVAAPSPSRTQGTKGTPPIITLSVEPSTNTIGAYSVVTWSVSGDSPTCRAEGEWQGERMLTGSMSTGKLVAAGTAEYRLICASDSGPAEKSVTLTVEAPKQ